MLRHEFQVQKGLRHLTVFSPPRLLSSAPCSVSSSHLISSEVPRQDPVVDIIGDTVEGPVDDFRGAPLGDAVTDSFGVGAVGEREELPIYSPTHLRGTDKCEDSYVRFIRPRMHVSPHHITPGRVSRNMTAHTLSQT